LIKLKGSKMEEKRIRKTYDRDFKVSVMKLILEKHQSVSKVSRDLGVSQNTLHLWKRSFLDEAEVRRLKQELSLVKEERDILKKAVGIFSETRR